MDIGFIGPKTRNTRHEAEFCPPVAVNVLASRFKSTLRPLPEQSATLDMIALSREAGLKAPGFRQDGGSFVQTLWRPTAQATGQATAQAVGEDKALYAVALDQLAKALGIPTAQAAAQVAKALSTAEVEAGQSRDTLQAAVDITHREHFRKAYLEPLVAAGWPERTLPDKPTSPNQKYRLTAKGRAWLATNS